MISYETISIFPILFCLTLCSYLDLKHQEIENYWCYLIVFLAFGLRIYYSIYLQDIQFFVDGFLGFCAAYLLGLVLVRMDKWGEADKIILSGIGMFLGFGYALPSPLLSYIIFLCLIGMFYSMAYLFFVKQSKTTPFVPAFLLTYIFYLYII